MRTMRSISSGLLLSAAILSSGWLSGTALAQTATKPALNTLAADFLHYSRVNNVELAKANGEAIVASGASPAEILRAFEAAGGNYRDVMLQSERRDELKDVAVKLRDAVDEGFRTLAREPMRIRDSLDALGNGPRAYQNARERLASAGEYAAPIMLSYLQDGTKQALRPFILRAMGEIGRPLLNPLIEELRVADPGLRVDVVKVLGEIGYPQALPALRALQDDAKASPELKMAVDAAILRIDSTGTAMKMSPSDLYVSGAQNYYNKRVSYQPLGANEKTNPVWYFDQGLNNVVAVQVPTVIWNDVMALRMTESALKADASNARAVALWNAANLRREIRLPKGEKDPTRTSESLDASFYALAAGPQYMNPVLSLALNDRDDALALRAIDVLEKTGGISGLVAGGDSPLVRALAHPNRAVRFHAAFALARANPSTPYASFFRVVPLLAEAVTSSENPTALLVVEDDDLRNSLTESLRSSGQQFTIYSGKTVISAMDAAQKAPAFDVIIVPAGTNRDNIATLARTDYRLAGVPVLVTAKAADLAGTKVALQNERNVAVIDEKVTAESVAAGLSDARAGAGATGALSAADATLYATESLSLLSMLASDHKSIYNVTEAVPTLIDALKDKRPEVVSASAEVLGKLNSPEAQQAIATQALNENHSPATRVMFFDNLRESAKQTGNTLDAAAINGIIKIVSADSDAKLRAAAAGALGALNISSNQSSTLILKQAK